MDLTHIHAHLKRLFTTGGHDHGGNRAVWWQDGEGEYNRHIAGVGAAETIRKRYGLIEKRGVVHGITGQGLTTGTGVELEA